MISVLLFWAFAVFSDRYCRPLSLHKASGCEALCTLHDCITGIQGIVWTFDFLFIFFGAWYARTYHILS